MFKSIKQLFIRENKQKPSEPNRSEVNLESNPRFLRNPARIAHLLLQLKESDALFTISIPGTEETFASTLLDTNSSNQYLLFDELNDRLGHDLLLKTKKFKVQASLNGVQAIFTCELIDVGSSKSIAYYKSPLPKEIYYPQRRQARRITLESCLPIPFHATLPINNTPILGHLQNISSSGIGALISSRVPCRRGELLKNCRVPLPDGTELNFNLIIRSLKPYPMGQKIHLGGFFENIDSKSHNKLEHFITKVEREQIKIENNHH